VGPLLDEYPSLGRSAAKADRWTIAGSPVFRGFDARQPGGYAKLTSRAQQLTVDPSSPPPKDLVSRGYSQASVAHLLNRRLTRPLYPPLVAEPPAVGVKRFHGLFCHRKPDDRRLPALPSCAGTPVHAAARHDRFELARAAR
jgi:hypothetical protein